MLYHHLLQKKKKKNGNNLQKRLMSIIFNSVRLKRDSSLFFVIFSILRVDSSMPIDVRLADLEACALWFFFPFWFFSPFFCKVKSHLSLLFIMEDNTVERNVLQFELFFRNPYNAYYKALMATAATSALRLHQRLHPVSLTREFMMRLTSEDSCHYLFFCIIFLYVPPVTRILYGSL